MARSIETLRQRGPLALIILGNTFSGVAEPAFAQIAEQRLQAASLSRVLSRLAPVAIVRGPSDMGTERAYFERIARAAGLPLFAPPRTPATRLRADSVVTRVGGLNVGLIGSPGDAVAEVMSYNALAASFRLEKLDLVVALLPRGGEQARHITAQLDRIDVAVGGGGEKPIEVPQILRDTLLVEAGSCGNHLGLLRLYRQEQKGPWLLRRKGLPPPAKGRYLTWELLAIGQELPAASWAVTQMGKL